MLLDLLVAFQVFDFGGALFGLICAIFIVSILVLIFVAIWMYRDAESRGMNGAMWAILTVVLTLFTGLIGLIIMVVVYLVVRGSHPVGGRPMYAPYGAPYGYPPPGYPPGYPPPGVAPPAPPPVQPAATAAAATCKNCGAPLPAGVAFCPNCGTKP
jgi:hypothetical protein